MSVVFLQSQYSPKEIPVPLLLEPTMLEFILRPTIALEFSGNENTTP